MSPLFRKIFGVIAGIGIGGALVMVVQFLNSTVFPPPAGLDLTDPEAIAQFVADSGPLPLLGVALSWFVGTFVGVFMATRVAQTRGRVPGGVVAVFFLAAALWTLNSFQHPVWFWVVGLGAIALAGHLGHAVGAQRPGVVAQGGTKEAPFE